MKFETQKSKVYIQTDDQGRILRCEGGYTTPADLTDWVEIDEGTGDRYNLCQSHYFPGGLYTMDGIPLYKWDGSQVLPRTGEEIEADRAAIPTPDPTPTVEERITDLETYKANQTDVDELTEALDLLLSGVTE